jgi:hypothetical protein
MQQTIRSFVILLLLQFGVAPLVKSQNGAQFADSLYQSYINTLKNEVLLVQLSDRASIRQKLVKYNETEKLQRFDQALKGEFKEIISGFNKYYSFGKVYFFLKSEAQLLKNGNFNKMTWINTTGDTLKAGSLFFKNYMIGEFSRMERRDSIYSRDANGKLLESEPKLSFHAFILRDAQFRIIDKKYYLHVRTILRNRSKVIKAFNKKLHKNLAEIKRINN